MHITSTFALIQVIDKATNEEVGSAIIPLQDLYEGKGTEIHAAQLKNKSGPPRPGSACASPRVARCQNLCVVCTGPHTNIWRSPTANCSKAHIQLGVGEGGR